MLNKKVLLGSLIVSIITIGGLAWSQVWASSGQLINDQPTPKITTCGCGAAGCGVKQQTGQSGCGCRNKANFIDANNNGVCDRAE